MAERPPAGQAPIGYWLKLADEAITTHADRVLRDNGFTRSRWQVLNTIHESGTISRAELFGRMKILIDVDQLNEVVAGFVREGWLLQRGEGDTTEYTLSDTGKAERETIFKLQSEVRRRAMQDVSEQEYLTVIDVLRRIVQNLE